jgi:hypothetical protein
VAEAAAGQVEGASHVPAVEVGERGGRHGEALPLYGTLALPSPCYVAGGQVPSSAPGEVVNADHVQPAIRSSALTAGGDQFTFTPGTDHSQGRGVPKG